MNRITAAIESVLPRVEALDAETFAKLDAGMAVTFEDHFAYQTAQSHAHAAGKITADEAQIIYMALGEQLSTGNGGWTPTTGLATKVIVTKIVSELIGA